MKGEVPLPAPPAGHPPAFVLGADADNIVDVQAVEETAALYNVQPHILHNSAHDVMLVRTFLETPDIPLAPLGTHDSCDCQLCQEL